VSLGVRLGCGMWDVGAWGMQHGMCGCMHVTASPRVGRYRHTGTQAHRHTGTQLCTPRSKSAPNGSHSPARPLFRYCLLPLQAGEGVRDVRCYRLVHSPRRSTRAAQRGVPMLAAPMPMPPTHTLTSTRPHANPALRSQPDTASLISPYRPWQRRIHSTAGRPSERKPPGRRLGARACP
jgi:hypothetical protein